MLKRTAADTPGRGMGQLRLVGWAIWQVRECPSVWTSTDGPHRPAGEPAAAGRPAASGAVGPRFADKLAIALYRRGAPHRAVAGRARPLLL